jgi:uncharacterized membrane protein YeaQ/YmgE (transglycosylase-associated protein family)
VGVIAWIMLGIIVGLITEDLVDRHTSHASSSRA